MLIKHYYHTYFWKGNIAKTKTTYQSSNYEDCKNNSCVGAASKAVDGNSNPYFANGSCTHTKYQVNPWWRVDLKERHLIRKVSLTNRADCCAYRLKNIEVRIGDHGCSPTSNPLYVHEFYYNYFQLYLFLCLIRIVETITLWEV